MSSNNLLYICIRIIQIYNIAIGIAGYCYIGNCGKDDRNPDRGDPEEIEFASVRMMDDPDRTYDYTQRTAGDTTTASSATATREKESSNN